MLQRVKRMLIVAPKTYGCKRCQFLILMFTAAHANMHPLHVAGSQSVVTAAKLVAFSTYLSMSLRWHHSKPVCASTLQAHVSASYFHPRARAFVWIVLMARLPAHTSKLRTTMHYSLELHQQAVAITTWLQVSKLSLPVRRLLGHALLIDKNTATCSPPTEAPCRETTHPIVCTVVSHRSNLRW
jgi:hypothetical protein